MKRNTLIFFKLESIHEKKESVINLLRKPITLILIIQIFSCPSIIMAMDAERGQEKGDHLTSSKSSTKQDERKDEEPNAVEMMKHEYTTEDIVNLIGCNLPSNTSIQRFWPGENDQDTFDTLQNVIYRLGALYILSPQYFKSLILYLDSFLGASFVKIQPEEIVIPYNPGGHWVILHIKVNEKIHIHYIDSLLSEHDEINSARDEEVCRSLTPLKNYLESHFSFKEVLPIEIILARTQEDNKACGPIIIENIRSITECEELSFRLLTDRDVSFLRNRQRAQLKSVGKDLDFDGFLSVSQSSEESNLDEGPALLFGASFIRSSVLELVDCFDVESFFRFRAKCLGIYEGPEPQLLSLSESYDQDALITVYSKGESGSIEMYKVYDPLVPVFDSEGTQIFKHQLMNGQEFVPQDKASGGTRVVGFYSINGRKKLCFKQWPEAPGHEIAMRYLYKSLFPGDWDDIPLPASEVILMNDQVFLVSEFIQGENLEQVLKKASANPNYGNQWTFNLEKFQKLVLFSLLTNPEDCRPQNCIVRLREGNEYEFVLIDNERSLVEEFIEYVDPQRGKVETRPHCFLFCFHELLMKPFDDIEINDNGLLNWQQYEGEQLYQYALYEHFKEKGLKKTKLCFWYSKKFMSNLYRKWNKIRPYQKNHQVEVHKQEHQKKGSLSNLFWEISPELAEIYKIPKEISEEIPRKKQKKSHKKEIERVSPKQAFTVNFSDILKRVREIDSGRMASTAPPSAYAHSNLSICSPILPDLAYKYSGGNLGDHEDSLTTFDLMEDQSLISNATLDLHSSWKTDVSVKAISRLINLTSLNLSDNPITNIGVQAIGRLTNLTFLDLSNNNRNITDVSALGRLTKLIYLNLRGNQITNINALGRLIKLTYLNLGRNQIEDISDLSQLINLTDLDLTSRGKWNLYIMHIDTLGQLNKLTSLVLCSNQATDINALSQLINLTYLNLYENGITSINALNQLRKLVHLNLGRNQIKSIRSLGPLSKLTYLNLGGNQIEDISDLSQLINLTFLDLWNNKIKDVSALGPLVNLTSLELGINWITDVTALGLLVNLISLNLFRNPIANAEVLNTLSKLTTLYLDIGLPK